MSELLPCPFCGGEAKIVGGLENWTPTYNDPDSGGDPIAVVCNCGCGLYANYDDYGEATAAWNRRTQPVTGNPATENKPLTLEEVKAFEPLMGVYLAQRKPAEELRYPLNCYVARYDDGFLLELDGGLKYLEIVDEEYDDLYVAYRNKPSKEDSE